MLEIEEEVKFTQENKKIVEYADIGVQTVEPFRKSTVILPIIEVNEETASKHSNSEEVGDAK